MGVMGWLFSCEGNLMSCWTEKAECGGREQEHSGWRRVTKIQDIFMGGYSKEEEKFY